MVTATSRLAAARAALATAQQQLGISTEIRSYPLLSCGADRRTLLTTTVTAMGTQGWAAFLQVPNICWEGAQANGLDLTRVICVEKAEVALARVCETLVDGFEVVVFGEIQIPFPLQKQLLARARARGTQLIVTTQPWNNARRAVA